MRSWCGFMASRRKTKETFDYQRRIRDSSINTSITRDIECHCLKPIGGLKMLEEPLTITLLNKRLSIDWKDE